MALVVTAWGQNARVSAAYTQETRASESSWIRSGNPVIADACGVDDLPDSVDSRLTVYPDATVTSDFCSPTDVDWIAMHLRTGVAYSISARWLGDDDRGIATPFIAGVMDAQGDLITGTHSFDGTPHSQANRRGRITFRATSSGIFYLEVRPSHCCPSSSLAGDEPRGAYAVDVMEADPPDDDVPNVEKLTLEFNDRGVKEAVFRGSIETFGDRDTFYFRGESERLYSVEMSSDSGIFNCIHGVAMASRPDEFSPDLRRCQSRPYEDAGVLVPVTNRGGILVVVGSGDAAGNYVFRVRDMVARPLTIHDAPLPESDVGSDTNTRGAVYVGNSWIDGTQLTGEFELALDSDWYRVELEEGHRYQIDALGSANGYGTVDDPYLRLHDQFGRRIEGAYDDDGGWQLDARLIYVATRSGIHFIEVRANNYERGTYALSVIDMGVLGTGARQRGINH